MTMSYMHKEILLLSLTQHECACIEALRNILSQLLEIVLIDFRSC